MFALCCVEFNDNRFMINKLKLITVLCPCLLLFFFPIIYSMKRIVFVEKQKDVERDLDLPPQTSIDNYLKALENIVNFGIKHNVYVDLNLKFGLFMIEVNLKSFMQDTRYNIPPKIRLRLEQILLKTDKLTEFFNSMVQLNNYWENKKYRRDMAITQLFYNATTWLRPPDAFNTDLLDQTRIYSPKELKKMYGKWKIYFDHVNDYTISKPTPEESDKCIGSLALTSPSGVAAECRVPRHCKKTLQEGSEYGYGLLHRLLFMIIARFSRKCIVFSEKQDKEDAVKYCRRCFSEAQYIASNNYKLPDLIYEQIALCGLFGHAQFFRHSWLQRLLQFQTSEGCFLDEIASGEFDKSQMKERKKEEWKISHAVLNAQVIADLPKETDFPAYYEALKKGVEFILAHKYYVDINLQFGLFLVDMNLRQFLEKERPDILTGILTRLRDLFEQIDELRAYYISMVEKHENDTTIANNKKLALLFYEKWPVPPDVFTTDLLNKTRILSVAELGEIYDTWENYHFNVYDVEENRPTPLEADECIALLVLGDFSHLNLRTESEKTEPQACGMNNRCKRVILGDNQYGYGLTHRLILLAVARFSVNCVMFSEKIDKFRTDMFCKKSFNEAEFIATNNYRLPDLLFEQVAVCGLFGHAQFIRRKWLNLLLRFQTKPGCFSEKLATGDFKHHRLMEDLDKEWSIDRPSDVIYGECNKHFTSVSLASLSHALRYIIETYY
ncbi:hypothetical protein PYW08_013831 [Mythimna loreyi]|uniref:Uncharacterized protein n=1 Tax=Mythimna loreyi TaxID=667449 RepID=A0ACC2R8D9_9NEOP|nr:hypothetical protein PYW08_013831 [Mythimna loreyi]